MYTRVTTCAFAMLVLAPDPTAQRQVRRLTTTTAAHVDPLISPNGSVVAFRGAGSIRAVSYAGGSEVAVASGASIGSFVWSPTSSGVYFLDGALLRFASATGGTPVTLTTLPGQQHRLWAVDGNDRVLWGTRVEQQTNRVFTVRTTGAQLADIVTDVLSIDDVALDPSGQFLLFGASVPAPFSPKEYFRVDAFTGLNRTSITGAPISGGNSSTPTDAGWANNGTAIVFGMTSTQSSLPHLFRASIGNPVEAITSGTALRRFAQASPSGRWAVHQALRATGLGPAVIPAAGGGLVKLSMEDNVFYVFQGPPSVDDGGTRVVFSATVSGGFSQIYAVDLDRELFLAPRAEVGRTFQLQMPIAASEVGVVFLGGGLLGQPIPLGSSIYGLILDPVVLMQIVSGSSASGQLSVPIPVPANAALSGQTAFFQGFRAGPTRREFTRPAELTIF